MAQQFDVIVIGLGGMGSATAYQLASRGARVLGLEQFTPAHDRGSSHGKSRIIRQAYFEGPAYVPLLMRAYDLWTQIEHDSNTRLLTITGGLMLGTPDSVVVTGSLRSAREYGLPHELLGAADVRRRFPAFTPAADVVALHEPHAGFVHPEASVAAHLKQAAALGATLRFEEPVQTWQAAPTGDSVTVTTAQGSYTAARLVLTAGAWSPALLADLALPLEVERQVLYWFDPIGGAAAFQPSCCPIYIWEAEPGIEFYGFPQQPGPPGGVKVAMFHISGEGTCDPQTIDRSVSDAEIERMRSFVAERVPALNSTCIATATCMYTNTPDHHFIIAQHPQHEQVIVASPCSGHGYKFASVIGEILADLAIDGNTQHPIALFHPQRFGA